MSMRRSLVSILLVLSVIALSDVVSSAQSSNNSGAASSSGTSLIVSMSGVADGGAIFGGTLLVDRFVSQGSGIAAVGTVTGVLTAANGVGRNLVFQAALPLDITSSLARLNTDAALAQAACDVLHVELAATSVNVLGSTIGLNPVAFDIASAVQAGTSASAPSVGTVTPSVSGNTTQASATSQFATGVATPGATPAVQTSKASTQPQTPLGSLLCSVNNFRDMSNPTQLIRQLNGIVTALASSGS